MKKLYYITCVGTALVISGCASMNASAQNATVKAQQTLDFIQSVHTIVVRGELIYIKQPGCGLAGSAPPPLCASVAVGSKMQSLDAAATKAIADAQSKLDTVGSDPTVIAAAIAAAQLAVTTFQDFTMTAQTGK